MPAENTTVFASSAALKKLEGRLLERLAQAGGPDRSIAGRLRSILHSDLPGPRLAMADQ